MTQSKKSMVPMGLIALIVVILIASLSFFQQQMSGKEKRAMKWEGILGSAVYGTWLGYKEIGSYDADTVQVEDVIEMSNHLASITAYSLVIDRATEKNLLSPIAAKMTAVLEQAHTSSELTSVDAEQMKVLIQYADEVHTLITDVYYVPDTVEGGKVTTTINDSTKLVAVDKQLRTFLNPAS